MVIAFISSALECRATRTKPIATMVDSYCLKCNIIVIVCLASILVVVDTSAIPYGDNISRGAVQDATVFYVNIPEMLDRKSTSSTHMLYLVMIVLFKLTMATRMIDLLLGTT
ncbi:uncharacterized protein LOC144436050 [Glandiceps talaboti]